MKATMNFELTNLLKEKGMIIPYAEFYDESSPEKNIVFYEKPTITEIVMWLYEKHRIWLDVYPQRYIDSKLNWTYSILKIEDGYTVDGLEFPEISDPALIPTWLTPTEAYQEAITYTLKNLIK